MASSSSSLSTTTQSEFLAVAKAFNYIPIKLDSSNYIFWKAQILAIIRAFDLVPFLNKSSPLLKFFPNSEGEQAVANSKYLNWIQLDQLLLGWLFSTIDKEVLTQVIHCESSVEVWISLESLYSRQTMAKSFQLKQ